MNDTTISLLAERRRTTLYVRRGPDGPVLLKVLNEEHPTPEELIRFRNDLEITRSLDIPGVRRGIRMDRVNGRHALVMEYVEGEALGDKIVGSAADLDEFLGLAIQIAHILGEVHERNIIHRDIKPENIIYQPAGRRVKLIDFGISSRIDLQTQHLGNPIFLEGTLPYISPEQTGRMNRVVDYRTDLYSLGASFYQLLTGRPPFEADDAMQLVHCHLAKIPVPPHELEPAVPEVLSRLVLKLLAKNAEDRYQSAFGVKRDLERCLAALRDSGAIQSFALAQQDLSGRFRLPQKLYGRDQALEELMTAFRSVSQGAVDMVVVRGYSGVGKSALIHEVHRPITETNGYFIQGKFDELQRSIPYYAPIQAFAGLIDILLTEGEDRLAAWKQRILDAVGGQGRVLTSLVPALERIIGPQPEVPELSDSEARNRLDYVIRRFIRTVSGPEHPLVLFIDDLQWADAASLSLLTALVTDPDSSHLLLIGAYRDNEVGPTHPLATALAELGEQGLVIRAIELGNLSRDDLGRLVVDALGFAPADCQLLVELLEEKTSGNPFAVAQYLTSLYEGEAIWFDFEHHRWQWDRERSRALELPDDVVDLLAGRIRKLTPDSQQVLQRAACIGNRFDLATLALVHEQAPRKTLDDLWPAITEHLVIPLGNAHRLLGAADELEAWDALSFRFAHDRVQQAAYSFIEEDQRKAVHRRIGGLLLSRPGSRQQHLFDIVNQLDFAVDLVTDADERRELAALNLEAGRQARMAAAHSQALSYLDTGMQLLPAGREERWTSWYELTLALYSEAAQAAYSTSAFERVDVLAREVLEHARTTLDAFSARNSLLRTTASRGSLTELIDLGLEALRELGQTFPRRPTMAHILAAFLRIKATLSRRRIEDIPDEAEMTDEVMRAAATVIERIIPAAFRSGSKLFPLLFLRLVSLSLAHGNTAASVYGYASYSIMLCGIMRSIDEAYRIGKMSLRLAERFSATPRMGDALFIFNVFARHWKDPLRKCVKPMRRAYEIGMENGRSFEAASAACYYLLMMQASGRELSEVERQLAEYRHVLDRDEAGHMGRLLRQVVANLLGHAQPLHLITGEHYDEAQVEARFATQADKTEVAVFYMYKVHLCLLAGEIEAAVDHADKGEAYLEAITGMTFEALFRFHAALARLALYRREPGRKELLRGLGKTRSLLRKWAKHGPDNYLHKHQLVEAEYARARGQTDKARDLYDRAVASARASKILPEEALALELASKFYRSVGHPILADAFLQSAVGVYEHWGAEAKVEVLRASSVQPSRQVTASGVKAGAKGASGGARRSTSKTTSTERSSTTESALLDLTSLMKASHAISAEIVMERLLASLIQIVVENAGAQQGALLLMDDGELRVQAQLEVDSGQISVMQGTRLGDSRGLCESLVRYVARTEQTRMVEDAGSDWQFRNDLYVRERGVRSMLCMPIKHKGMLTGVLYLENNLTTGAFTPALVEILQILSSQAAVSLENARLYGHQVELAQALRRFVPDEFLKNLQRESIAEVQLGDSVQKQMSILFSDIRGFTTLVEGMSPEENIGFINGYLRYMEPCIGQHGGFVDSYIGDAIMALFEGDADNAVTAAVEMLRALERMNQERLGQAQPAISIGIGINTGMLTLGTIGGESRLKCGVIGDSVNLASRVESQTKRYGVPLLISDQTYQQLRRPGAFHTRIVDKVRVVGRSEPVTLYEVFDTDPEARKQAKQAVAGTYARALALYYQREFAGALRLLEECLETLGEDKVVSSYIERCRRYGDLVLAATWTGVEELAIK